MVPHPSVPRYWAMVVVNPPEFEKMAIDPLSSASSGIVAAERAADAHAVPGIRNPETVGAKYVDAVGLADRPDLARVMHRDFFGDHDDLLEVRVHADKLGDAVAHAGRGQVDDAGVEREAIVQPFADVVIDRECRRRASRSTWPRRPGDVPKTTLPPEKA